jgi:glycogen operon protein
VTWHGTQAWNADWSGSSRTLAFMLCGHHAKGGTEKDDYIYVATNTHWEGHTFELPQLPDGRQWHVAANTNMPSPEDIWEVGQEPWLEDQHNFFVGPRSAIVLVGK